MKLCSSWRTWWSIQHHSLPELFVAIAQRLRRVVAAETAKLSLHDPTKNVMRLHLWELPVPDLASESRFLPIMSILRAKGLKSPCWLPLTTAR
jgi:hypothetical protein